MFAQVPPPPKPASQLWQNPEFLVGVGSLVAALLVAAVVLHFVDRWRRRQDEGGSPGLDSANELTMYREMYENGEITQSEYERIRNKIAAQMKKEVGLDRSAPPPPPPPPDGSAPPGEPDGNKMPPPDSPPAGHPG